MKLSRFLTATALASAAFAFPHVASAQDTGDETETTEDVVVTGSRIVRPGIDTPVPVTSVTVEELTDSGNLSLGDALNQLPSLRSTYSQANSTRFIGTAGLNLIDLRGLGVARTLVVVNGRRHVNSTPGSYGVDVNTIPVQLLERVDVVTGGNSATYGSDAVAGVVNFVLKQDYEGLEIVGQGGISSRSDRDSQRLGVIWGTNFAEGRGNIAIAGEYARSKTLLFTDREEQTGAVNGLPGYFASEFSANETGMGDGIPDQTFFPGGIGSSGNRFGIISLGGMVQTSCPALTSADPIVAARIAAVCTGMRGALATTGPNTGGLLSDGWVFNPDGTLVRDNPALDLRYLGGGRFGGRSATGVEGAMLLPGLERYAANLLFKYEFSPAFEVFLEGKYVHITNNQTSTQPTFINGSLSPAFFLDNPYLTTQARNAIRTIMGYAPGTANYDTGGFTFFRFNNDIGTRSEDHERKTFRIVGGFRGDLSDTGNLRYEIAGNFGRTETYYETGGNVNVARFNRAVNAVRNPAGQIVCRVNADASTTNDDPNCRPLNVFGEGAPSTTPDGLAYVLHTSWRKQWAEQLNFVGFVSADTEGFFKLPGGPVSMVLGAEYRREDAYSDYDDVTQSGATFLNGFATFDPPAIDVKEAFAELRLPLLADMPFFHELSIEGSGRVSKYSNSPKEVWAYNVGAVWAPIRDLRFRAGYAKSVRAPDLSDVYATPGVTFANNLVDPCSQGTPINSNPNRARNCAAAGVPTTITLPDGSTRPWVNAPSSGIQGVSQGNINLEPEVGHSFTAGMVFQPSFVRGLTVTVDYYNIEIKKAINSLTGQAIIDRCYDDPVGIDNPFCAVVFRRSSSDPMVNGTFAGQAGRRFDGFPDFNLLGPPYNQTQGTGFLQVPFNYAKLKTSGIDVDVNYTTRAFGEGTFSARAFFSWLAEREQFTYITNPSRSDRINGTLGDPEWQGQFSANLNFPTWDLGYDLRYVGKQTVFTWETQFSHQGRQPTNGDVIADPWYPAMWYHDMQLGFKVADNKYRFYIGVDNIFDTLPPLGATGTGAGSGIWPVTGRYFYAGFRVRM
ncbi:TonB-dependent receptor domain-containing protein [Sphingomonas sp.]|uniref:TonB-dependent receptor domain-containing protein n=1 Tax=Sphingomonas sp. TaxID=28214 RepID=UPI002ED9AA11